MQVSTVKTKQRAIPQPQLHMLDSNTRSTARINDTGHLHITVSPQTIARFLKYGTLYLCGRTFALVVNAHFHIYHFNFPQSATLRTGHPLRLCRNMRSQHRQVSCMLFGNVKDFRLLLDRYQMADNVHVLQAWKFS